MWRLRGAWRSTFSTHSLSVCLSLFPILILNIIHLSLSLYFYSVSIHPFLSFFLSYTLHCGYIWTFSSMYQWVCIYVEWLEKECSSVSNTIPLYFFFFIFPYFAVLHYVDFRRENYGAFISKSIVKTFPRPVVMENVDQTMTF